MAGAGAWRPIGLFHCQRGQDMMRPTKADRSLKKGHRPHGGSVSSKSTLQPVDTVWETIVPLRCCGESDHERNPELSERRYACLISSATTLKG